jgi:cobyrinic acid a,c-diamide synthase
VPVAERRAEARRTVAELAAAVAAGCDLNAIAALAAGAPGLQVAPWEPAAVAEVSAPWDRGAPPRRIAIASGPAFSFVYQENLELLEANGAELVAVDPTVDERLPEDSGALCLGGGFPETYAGALAANQPLRAAVRRFAMGGRPVVAECGGLLYLSRRLDGLPMCGVLQADGRMTDRLTLGYRQASAASPSPLAHPGHPIRGHEFHYSTLDPPAGAKPAWLLGDPAQRPAGSLSRGSPAASVSNGRPEGFVAGRVHASFLHTHWAAFPDVPSRLVTAAGVAS